MLERRRARLLDAAIVAALLIVGAMPVRDQLRGEPMLGAVGRIHVAWEDLNRRAFVSGDLPVWNPYEFGGRPHLADPGTLTLYPPHVALRWLPSHLLFPVSLALHAWLAGLGAYLVARRLLVPRVAAGMAAAAVMLSGALAYDSDIAYSAGIYGIAWLPLIVFFTLKSAMSRTMLPNAGLVATSVMALIGSPRGPLYVASAVIGGFLLARLLGTASGLSRRVAAQAAVFVLLIGGLTAFQTIPMAMLWLRAAEYGGLARYTPSPSRPEAGTMPVDPDPQWIGALASLDGGRVVSECDRGLDASHLVRLSINGTGGGGGVLMADYARFLNLVRGGGPPEWASSGNPDPDMPARVRTDLLPFLHAEYLVACREPDSHGWTPVAKVRGAGLYRSVRRLPRAFWTCMPQQVDRQELEYRLWRSVYDDRLSLNFQGPGRPGRVRGPSIDIRWAPAVDDAARERAEAELPIYRERFRGERTWRYELMDRSGAALTAIMSHPLVEDTGGFDRSTLSLTVLSDERREAGGSGADGGSREWLLGLVSCEEFRTAEVLQADGLDGRMVVAVDAPRDGLVFLSEPFYPGRRVWVDGSRVEPLKVNLAFTGVPVTAGVHRIELQYDPLAFPLGAGMSVVTATAWAALVCRRRTTATPEPARTADAPSA
jgi:hypothetical protein